MNRISAIAACALISVLTCACAQSTALYDWGPYEDDVLALYKEPGFEREFAEHLKVMIDESRKKGVKTPPGVAAEFGYLEYKAGRGAVAIEYFDLERTNWPESAVLMTRLIERIEETESDVESEQPAESKAQMPRSDEGISP